MCTRHLLCAGVATTTAPGHRRSQDPLGGSSVMCAGLQAPPPRDHSSCARPATTAATTVATGLCLPEQASEGPRGGCYGAAEDCGRGGLNFLRSTHPLGTLPDPEQGLATRPGWAPTLPKWLR